MRVWNYAWIGESESISTGALKEEMGLFVRQDELSTQGVYVKVLWPTTVRLRGERAISCCKSRPGLQSIRQRSPGQEVGKDYRTAGGGEFDEADQAIGQGYCPLDGQDWGLGLERAGGDWTTNSDVAFVAFPPFLI